MRNLDDIAINELNGYAGSIRKYWDDGITHTQLEDLCNFIAVKLGNSTKQSSAKAIESSDSSDGGVCEFCGCYDKFASRSPKHNNQVRCYSHW